MSTGLPQKRDRRSLVCEITWSEAGEGAARAEPGPHAPHTTTAAATARRTENMLLSRIPARARGRQVFPGSGLGMGQNATPGGRSGSSHSFHRAEIAETLAKRPTGMSVAPRRGL